MKNAAYFFYRWMSPFVDPVKAANSIPGYFRFFKDWMTYARMEGAESINIIDTYPILHERTATTDFSTHYFYQNIWAFKKILASGVISHIDIGSQVDFAGLLSVITSVTFFDIRPLKVKLNNFTSIRASILSLPCGDKSVHSLSCLHVAEHVGLGRYGDPLDPQGTHKACRELSRILAHSGNLYFSLPVGKPRLCFNGHRIHTPETILDYFSNLECVELSGITDDGEFIENIDMSILDKSNYACGLFWFRGK